MAATTVTVPGVVTPEGTLELNHPLGLPPGPVEVVVTSIVPSSQGKEDTWEVLERIWAEQKAMGFKPRTREEIDRDVQELRDELEEHALAVEHLQERIRAEKEQPC